ncbi:MAG TPA: PEGA domain-containing protein [Bacteroidota bacterium]|nr:PEGA domain-containing protein [Bacteroidota bacterium]
MSQDKLLLCVALFLSAAAFGQPQNVVSTFVSDPSTGKAYHAYDESFALIVGVDHYTHAEPRTSAVSSAKGFKDLLMSRYGFKEANIIFLLDDQARLDVIRDALKKIQRHGGNDRLILFLSGRGYTARDRSGNDYGFFIPFDGNVQTPAQALATCVSLEEIKKAIGTNSVKHSIVLLDFSVGGLPVLKQYNGIPPPRMRFDEIVQFPTQELLTAGDRIESMEDDTVSGMSVFTTKLIEALSSGISDVNGDGIITGTELAARTSVRVTEATGWKNRPQFGFFDEGKGDFLFVLPDPADTSRVTITVNPSGAAVFLDQKQLASTALTIPVLSPKLGIHTLQAQEEGYRPSRAEFFVNGRVSIKASLSLEKISTRRLRVVISQPDARIFVDGKFIGMPDHSLLIDPIAPGTHSVTAELDGYFPDSTSVNVQDTVEYIADLHLLSRNGFLTVHSSTGVDIEVDGEKAGTEEIAGRELLPGPHSIRLSGIGYDTYERAFIVHDSESVTIDHPMSRPTLGGALLRSIVFPGWGQSYSGRHGIVYAGLFIVSVAGTIELQQMYTDANSKFRTTRNAYNAAQTTAEQAAILPLLNSRRTAKNNLNYARLGAAGFTGTVYLYNILNVLWNNPATLIREEEENARQEKSAMNISIRPDGPGATIAFSYQF